jgi:hypothetical protein
MITPPICSARTSRFWACLGLITFLMAFVYTLIAAHTRGTMRITYLYFGPSEIRALLLLGNLLTLVVGVVDLRHWFPVISGTVSVSIHDAFIALLVVVGVVVIALLACRDARAPSMEDPTRRRTQSANSRTKQGCGPPEC